MGHTIQHPTEDKYLMTKEDLENKMAVLLAGRAAEMVVFEKLSTGASDDLLKATQIAREMVMHYGMSDDLGFVTYEEQASLFLDTKEGHSNYSDETAKDIDENVKRFVMKAYQRAFQFLQ